MCNAARTDWRAPLCLRLEANSRTASVFVSFFHSVAQKKNRFASVILSSPYLSPQRWREEKTRRERKDRKFPEEEAATDIPGVWIEAATPFYPALLESGPRSLGGKIWPWKRQTLFWKSGTRYHLPPLSAYDLASWQWRNMQEAAPHVA